MTPATTSGQPGGPTGGPSSRLVTEALRLLPNLVRMLSRAVRDPEVPTSAKVRAGALLALGVGPWDAVPVLGQAELLAMGALAVRQLLTHAGEDRLRKHWDGTDRGFDIVMTVAKSGLKPWRLVWHGARALRRH